MSLGVGCDVHGVDLLAHGGERTLGIGSGNAHQFGRPRIGKRPQKDAADQAENCGIRTDPKCERKRRNRREPKALVQLAQPETNVLHKSSHFFSFIRSGAL